MTEDKIEAPGYMTFREAALMFSLMPEPDAAKAIKATVNYYLYGEIPDSLDGVSAQVFHIMRADIDRNNEKYRKIVKRNRENIGKRWADKDDTGGLPVVYDRDTNKNHKQKHKTLSSKQQAETGTRGCGGEREKPALTTEQEFEMKRQEALKKLEGLS